MGPRDERNTRIDHLDAETIIRLLGQLGHAVGTPVGSILLMAEMLGDELERLGADERLRRRADDLGHAAHDVRSVVQGVVHLLRLHTGWISPHAGRLDVTHLLENLREKGAAAGLEVRSAGDETGRLPEKMETDPGFVQEIAAGLLAWHAGRAGGGRLDLCGSDAGLRLTLRSEGAAVPWEEAAVLDPVAAGELDRARHHGGAGLELARVHALARRLGGGVQGRNEEGAVVVEVEIPEAGVDPLA